MKIKSFESWVIENYNSKNGNNISEKLFLKEWGTYRKLVAKSFVARDANILIVNMLLQLLLMLMLYHLGRKNGSA